MRLLLGLVAGVVVSLGLLAGYDQALSRPSVARPGVARPAVATYVREDGGALRAVLIHYSPAAAALALPTYRNLLRALPSDLVIHVACATATDCADLRATLQRDGVPHLERLRPVIVGAEITTWSRDRFAARQLPGGALGVLAPPRAATPFEGRAGDAVVPFALGRTVGAPVTVASFAFEGGDLAATADHLFLDVNLLRRNELVGPATSTALLPLVRREFRQEVVFLGQEPGDLPEHHIMMYMAPLGGRRVVVGDVAAGLRLVGADPLAADRRPVMAARFDRAAAELAARGFEVTRLPVVPLEGGAAYVTYTNVVLADEGATKVVYLPQYGVPRLDAAGRAGWERLGYAVRPIDVSAIYRLGGSVGCLVNVLERG